MHGTHALFARHLIVGYDIDIAITVAEAGSFQLASRPVPRLSTVAVEFSNGRQRRT
jgi:hypothetical protein